LLEEYLNIELARLGLGPERLALVGFSQGTMMSLHVGLRRKVPPAAIVGFSGLLAGAVPVLEGDIPPILLTHGDADSVIPPQAMFLAANQLGLAGACVQWHLARGMGHGIDPEGLSIAGHFLDLAFRGLLKSHGPAHCVLKPS
jgi:phospholipase/carboxylesterase